MVPDDRHDRIRKVDLRENFCAHPRVRLHAFELGWRELARLVEDVLGDGELPDIVQQRGGLDGAELSSSSTPTRAASATASLWTRRMCPCVTASLASIASPALRWSEVQPVDLREVMELIGEAPVEFR